MIKSALEKVISEDMAEIWTILEPDEKRKIIDSFVIHNYKKNQMIYAEGEDPYNCTSIRKFYTNRSHLHNTQDYRFGNMDDSDCIRRPVHRQKYIVYDSIWRHMPRAKLESILSGSV